jgi:hypothetical protein
MLHRTYKLFMFSLWLECTALFGAIAAYGRFANDGVGAPFTSLCSRALRATSTLVFLMLLVVLAKGAH